MFLATTYQFKIIHIKEEEYGQFAQALTDLALFA